MNYYFKVKIGFGKDDFICIDDTELRSAINAQITGKIAVFKEGTIAGNSILSILPNWNKIMGWNRDYELKGEDYEEIGESKQRDYRNYLTSVTNEVKGIAPVERNPALSEAGKKLADKFGV